MRGDRFGVAKHGPPAWAVTLRLSDRLHAPPWEIDPFDAVPRFTWRARALMLMECEAEIGKSGHRRPRTNENIERVRRGEGRFQGRH